MAVRFLIPGTRVFSGDVVAGDGASVAGTGSSIISAMKSGAQQVNISVRNDTVEGFYLASSTGVVYGAFTPHNVSLRTNNTDRITILAAGNVGIGTSTPTSKLSVVGLPTSATGLAAGDVWNNLGVLNIV